MSNNAGGAGAAGNNEAITVVVRCRPMNKKETEEKHSNIIDVDIENRSIGIKNLHAGEDPKYFTFDATYDEKTQQRHFYEESCFNIIESALEGFNATIFAYGQTGCGKSFTMQGPSTTDEDMRGVIPNSFYHIFQFVKSTKNVEFLIRCSYLELYNEEIRDLLTNQKNPPKCELKEDNNKGVYVKGLSDVVVETPEDLVKMFDRGLTNRTTASTNMNSESSRSHSVFSIVIEMSTKDETTGKDMLRVGKLNLVDLAGSERAKKTGAKDQVLKEGIKINLSLTALGNVISALSEGGRHIPYRDSKLTRLLQDSLGGSAKTMMVAAISPAGYNYEETLSTLRYANRAKNIKNKPKINEDPKDTMIREFKAEIERLKTLLMQQNSGALLAQLGVAVGVAVSGVVAPNASAPTMSHSPQAQKAVSHRALAGEVASVDTSSETFSRASPRITNEMTETENYVTNDFVESDAASPKLTTMGRTTSSVEDGYGTGEFEQYIPENDAEGVDVAEIRDEIEQRIHQLAHMLVNNQDEDNLDSTMTFAALESGDQNGAGNLSEAPDRNPSTKLSPVKSEKIAIAAPTEEELAREANSIREYKERKQRAKQKREEKQRREMQRVLDEKKLMEEELEELRFSSQQLQQFPQFSQAQQLPSMTDDSQASEKKIQKLKKKYEKKVVALSEELEEVREDFAYQRKQLMDAVVEQEKDTRLYEAICRSLVSERDLQKILEKSRYDDERDEWSVPYSKKKNMDNLLDNNNGLGGNYGHGNSMPPLSNPYSANSNNNNNSNNSIGGGSLSSRSMLPDITSNNGNRLPQSFKPQPPIGQVQEKRGHKSKHGNKKKPKIPLLTLPGSLVSAADLDGDDNGDGSNFTGCSYDGNNQGNNSNNFPQHSGRLQDNTEYVYVSNNEGSSSTGPENGSYYHNTNFALPGIAANSGMDNKKKSNNAGFNGNGASSNGKSKLAKNANSTGSNSINNSLPKMPAVSSSSYGNNNIYYQPQDNSGNYSGEDTTVSTAAVDNGYNTMIDQAGSGENAGPIEDWGFVVKNGNNGNNSKNKKRQDYDDEGFMDAREDEVNYSDDEDFVDSSNINAAKKKKKNKNGKNKSRHARNSRENGDEYGSVTSHHLPSANGDNGGNRMFPPISNSTPRQSGGFSLPPI